MLFVLRLDRKNFKYVYSVNSVHIVYTRIIMFSYISLGYNDMIIFIVNNVI